MATLACSSSAAPIVRVTTDPSKLVSQKIVGLARGSGTISARATTSQHLFFPDPPRYLRVQVRRLRGLPGSYWADHGMDDVGLIPEETTTQTNTSSQVNGTITRTTPTRARVEQRRHTSHPRSPRARGDCLAFRRLCSCGIRPGVADPEKTPTPFSVLLPVLIATHSCEPG